MQLVSADRKSKRVYESDRVRPSETVSFVCCASGADSDRDRKRLLRRILFGSRLITPMKEKEEDKRYY